MKNIESVKELCSFFWDIERELSLLDSNEISKFWIMARMNMYYLISKRLKIFSEPHPYRRSLSWFLFYFSNVIFSTLKNILKWKSIFVSDAFVFEHPRTKIIGNCQIDIYSKHYIEKLMSGGKKVVVLSKTENGIVDKNDGFTRVSIDSIEILRKILAIVVAPFIKNRKINLLSKYIVTSYLGGVLTEKEVKVFLKRSLVEYFVTYWIYRFLFFIAKNVKEVVVVDSYSSKAGMIAAAKKNNLYVRELQHGVITKYHLGYSYAGAKGNSNFIPDQILVWSEFWKSVVIKLSPIKAVDVLENDFISGSVSKNKERNKCEKKVVIISQGAISEALANFIIKHSYLFDAYKVVYKLHPSEVTLWKNSDNLLAISKMDNFEVVEEGELYDYISTASYVLGVFSTALFEAIELGCKVVVLPLPGSEYMDEMQGFLSFDDWVGVIKLGGNLAPG